ncbi:MAG: polysaccharide biosynthesis C-terminal domain-containing protein [Flavobacteriales bacterium]
MIRPIIGTIGTRVVITAMNLLLIMAAGRTLGTAGLGAIGLIVLGITFILLLNNVIGGGALVYLAPRYSAVRLLVPSYIWAAITATVAFVVLRYVPLVPPGTAPHVVLLALLQSVNGIHVNMLLGRQRIGLHNTILVLQGAILLVLFGVLSSRDGASVDDYIGAAYVAHASTVVLSGIGVFVTRTSPQDEAVPVWRALFTHGGLVQAANFMQLLNYRFTYYVLERMHGLAALGLYSVAVQLAESAWIAPKSLGTVLYSHVSNTTDVDRQRDLTLTILKASLVFTVLVVSVLLVLPDAVFQWLFGEEVFGMGPIVAVMAPGLIAMSASQAFSHFFSGTGRNRHNAVGSGLALVCTIVAAIALVGHYGLMGAAITASMAYAINGLYQAIVFARLTHTTAMDWLPGIEDLRRLQRLIPGNRQR